MTRKKTCTAVTGESKVPFFSLSGSDFVEMFVGVGAARVSDLFRQAKEKAPCIVFVDELDALGKARRGLRTGGGRSNIDDISTSAHNDLSKATDIAHRIVKQYGMSRHLG